MPSYERVPGSIIDRSAFSLITMSTFQRSMSSARALSTLASSAPAAVRRTLVLNVTWEPLTFIAPRRAIQLRMASKVDVVADQEVRWRSEREEVVVPAVVVLRQYVKKKEREPVYSKRGVFARDAYQCQYCGDTTSHMTIDHVQPLSRGGETSWFNCVCACQRCNHRKKNYSLRESGMTLRRSPTQPRTAAFFLKGKDNHLLITDPLFQPYLGSAYQQYQQGAEDRYA